MLYPGPNEYPRVLDYLIFKSLLVPYSKNFTTRSSSRVIISTFFAQKIQTCQIKITKNHTFTMFFLCEIILFLELMDREKDQQIGADVNTTPQPSNGPLICVFSHSPHSVKFVSRFHWVHARVAPKSGQLMQGIQIMQQTNKQMQQKKK